MSVLDPTATAIRAVRRELIIAGLVRRPADAGTLPPCFLEPPAGPPAPGDRGEAGEPYGLQETAGLLVVTLRLSTTLPGTIADAYRRRTIIDLIYRSTTSEGMLRGRMLHEQIRRRIVDANAYRLGQTLAAGTTDQVSMLSAEEFAGIGPVSDIGNVHTDTAKLIIETLA